jgi:hypothetical protein
MEPNSANPEQQGLYRLSDFGKQYFELLEFDGNEVLLLEIRKHIFGLILIYLVGAFVALAILITTVVLASGGFLEDIGFGSASAFVVFLGFVFSVGIGVVTYINGYLYKHNVIFVTSEKIAQVVNITIFHRKVSQLSIGDAQDVTVSQKTFFARAFNYGTLVIETAGEQQNYTFDYVPNPYPASKIIVGSHEQDKQKHGN